MLERLGCEVAAAVDGREALQIAGARDFDIVLSDSRDGDDRLAAAIARHRPVLAQVFALEQELVLLACVLQALYVVVLYVARL